MTEGSYLKGGQYGIHIAWYKNNNRKSQKSYDEGKLAGLSVLWNMEGLKISEVEIDGKPGVQIRTTNFVNGKFQAINDLIFFFYPRYHPSKFHATVGVHT